MKKKLLTAVLASGVLASMVQAKFYVGIEGGYSVESQYKTGLSKNSVSFSVPSTNVISNAFKNETKGYSVAGVFGTEDFYGKYFGTRWGVSAGYTQVSIKDAQNRYVDAGLNLDLMLNFINTGSFSLGVFGGVSGDYHYQLDVSRHLLDFNGRVGLSTLITSHHRLEFVAKLPIASMNAAGQSTYLGADVVPARTSLGASYKFIF